MNASVFACPRSALLAVALALCGGLAASPVLSQTAAPAAPAAPPTLVAMPAAATPSTCPALEGANVRQVVQGDLRVSWKPLPSPIPLNKPFELELVLCGEGAQLVRVDADMPAHRHGMNYRTSLRSLAPQHMRAQGLVFHMSGQWRVIFEVQRGPQRLRLSDTVQLP